MSIDEDLPIRARGPAMATRSDPRARSWVLLLLDSLARTGITPISKLRFHRLIYICNCLSRIYGLPAADERIVKHRRGPFYPDLQWHLDRLVGQGLARITCVRHFSDEIGAWMEADYALHRRGLDSVGRLGTVDSLRAIGDFLLEVAKAYAAQKDESLNDLVLADLTYDDARRGQGAVIDFSRQQDNLTAQAADSFAVLVRDSKLLTVEDRIHLYVEYLDRAWGRRRQAGSSGP